jgi:hypothetical protein
MRTEGPRRASLAVALVVGLALPSAGQAMRIQTFLRPLAWSDDGQSLLLVEDQQGPEGGDALTYVLVSVRAPHYQRFQVSSDFSTGSSHLPQRVTAGACRTQLDRLVKSAPATRFPGLQVLTGRCAGKDRTELLRPSPALTRAMAASAFAGQVTLKLGALVLLIATKEVVLQEAGKPVGRWPLRMPPNLSPGSLGAWLEPGRRLLVLTSADGVILVLASPTGDLAKLQPVPLP